MDISDWPKIHVLCRYVLMATRYSTLSNNLKYFTQDPLYELWTEIWGSLRSFLYKTVLVKPVNIGIRCLSLQLYNNLCIILSGSCQAVSSPYWDLNDLLNLNELFLYKIILFYIFVSELELGPVSRIVYFDSFGKYFKKFLYFTKNDLQWGRQSKPQRINEIGQYWTKTNSI